MHLVGCTIGIPSVPFAIAAWSSESLFLHTLNGNLLYFSDQDPDTVKGEQPLDTYFLVENNYKKVWTVIKHCHDLASVLTCDSSTVFNVRHVPENFVGCIFETPV